MEEVDRGEKGGADDEQQQAEEYRQRQKQQQSEQSPQQHQQQEKEQLTAPLSQLPWPPPFLREREDDERERGAGYSEIDWSSRLGG